MASLQVGARLGEIGWGAARRGKLVASGNDENRNKQKRNRGKNHWGRYDAM